MTEFMGTVKRTMEDSGLRAFPTESSRVCKFIQMYQQTDGSPLDLGFHGCIDYIWLSCDLSKV